MDSRAKLRKLNHELDRINSPYSNPWLGIFAVVLCLFMAIGISAFNGGISGYAALPAGNDTNYTIPVEPVNETNSTLNSTVDPPNATIVDGINATLNETNSTLNSTVSQNATIVVNETNAPSSNSTLNETNTSTENNTMPLNETNTTLVNETQPLQQNETNQSSEPQANETAEPQANETTPPQQNETAEPEADDTGEGFWAMGEGAPEGSYTTSALPECTFSCGDTISEGCQMSGNLECTGTGVNIGDDNVTLDCMGYSITGDGGGGDKGVYNNGYDNITIRNCVISYFEYGIHYYNSAANGFIYNNTIGDNSGDYPTGVYFDSAGSGNRITGNTIYNHTYGIDFYQSSSNNASSNNITYCTDGIIIADSGSNNNLFYDNYLSNNSNANAADSAATNYWNTTYNCSAGPNIIGGNCIGGNFWSDYNGADTNSDGVGDTNLPHTSSGNINTGGDYLPLVYTNNPPTQSTPILNSSLGTNYTSENLTVYNQSTYDADSDPVKNIINWYKDGSSIMVLNMPFENNGSDAGTKDYSGYGNDGTEYNGVAWNSTGGFDGKGAYEFDGTNNYIETPTIVSPSTLSISFWTKTTSTDDDFIFTWSNYRGCRINGLVPNKINCLMDGGSTGSATSSSNINDGAWHHIVITSTSNSQILYFDGESEDTASETLDTRNGEVNLGSTDNGASYFFDGTIDEVRIYNHTLSPEQVNALYNNRTDLIVSQETSVGDIWQACITPNDGTEDGATNCSNNLTIVEAENQPPTQTTPILNSTLGTNYTSENLTVYNQSTYDADSDEVKNIINWYKNGTSIMVLNMPFENNGSDAGTKDYSPYGNDGTEAGDVTWNSTAGYDGKGAYEFDGSGDYINLGSSSSLDSLKGTQPFTVSVWIKQNIVSTGPTIYNVFGKGTLDNLAIDQANSKWRFVAYDGGYKILTSDVTPVVDTWYHLVMTFDGSDMRGYVDNVEQATPVAVGSITEHDTDPLTIGSWGADRYFPGTIDEVRIYNYSLSPEQIKALYENRTDLVVSQETSIGDVWQACITPNDGYEDGGTNCSNNLTITEPPPNQPPTQGIPILNSTFGTNYTSENLTVYNQSTYDADSDEVKNIINWYKNGTSIMVLNMPFENNGSDVGTNDYSDYDNDGIETGDVTWNSTAGYDGKGAYEFDGDGDYIRIPHDSSLKFYSDESFALESWIKTNATSDGNCIRTQQTNWALYGLRILSGGSVQFLISDGTNLADVVSPALVGDGEWHHIVGVRDVTEKKVKVYIDGVKENEATDTTTGNIINSQPVYIGVYEHSETSTYSGEFNGTIDEVRIYNRSISSEQVKALYKNRTDLIVSQETSGNDIWQACITSNDGYEGGAANCSNNLTIINNQAVVNITINSTSGNNYTTDNLTIYYDLVNGADRGTINWEKNSQSIAVLNMPFDVRNNPAKDYSGYNNNGIATGAGWNSTAGYDGKGAYEFDGKNDYILVSNAASLSFGTEFSASAWVYVKGNETSNEIFRKVKAGTSNKRFLINTAGKVLCYLNDVMGGTALVTSAQTVKLNTWTHVACVYNGTNATIYVNGNYNTSKSASGNIADGSLSLYIGSSEGSDNFFNGTIDELRIYNISLSAEQVKALYENRTDLIVSNETSLGDIWQACITPNDGYEDGTEKCSNNLTILNSVPTITLVSPEDGANGSTNLNASFIYSDADNDVGNCSLYVNGTVNATNSSVTSGITTVITSPGMSDGVYSWFINCTDGEVWVNSSTRIYILHIDPPTFSNAINYSVDFKIYSNFTANITITNVHLSHYIFSTNVTGSWWNDTAVDISGNAQYNASVSKNITLIQGNVICWYYWANDTVGYSSSSSVHCFTVNNTLPTHDPPILNSTYGTNYTNENLTVYNQSTYDGDGDSVKNIINWYKDNTSIMVLNMPFEGGSESGDADGVANGTLDYSGYENHGNVTDATWNSTGGYDGFGAYEFDGAGDSLTANSLNFPSGAIKYTILWWIYPLNAINYNQQIGAVNTWGAFSCHTESGGGMFCGTSTTITSRFTPTELPDGTLTVNDWNHFAYVFNENHAWFYKNGLLLSDKSMDAPTESWGGFRLSSSIYGSIDEVRIYNYSLSPEQIKALYENRTDLIVSNETSLGDVWRACITPNDGYEDGDTNCSNNLTVVEAVNSPPTQAIPILNSTLGTNLTTENLTVYNQSTSDPNGDPVKNIINWYKDGSSIAVLNMPFEALTAEHSDVADQVSAWFFEGDADDETGRNNGTAGENPSLVTGKVGQAYEFNGTNYIDAGNMSDFGSQIGTSTVSVWVKTQDTSTITAILKIIDDPDDVPSATDVVYGIEPNRLLTNDCTLGYSAGKTLFYIRGTDANSFARHISTDIYDNEWHHIVWRVISSSNNKMEVYVDGVNQTLETGTGDCFNSPSSFNNWKDTLVIGGNNNRGTIAGSFNGTIDEVQIWNQSLSVIEIRELYRLGLSSTEGARDYSGYENVGTVNDSTFNSAAGYDGKGAYEFDGLNDYIEVPGSSSIDLRNNLTISAWVYFKGEGTGNHIIVSKKYSSSLQYALGRYAGSHEAFLGMNIGGWSDRVISAATLSDNQWYHVVGTYDGANAKIYINGALDNSSPQTGSLSGDNTNRVLIGADANLPTWTEYTNATIDEALIYNYSLSAEQIKALYENKTELIVSQETSVGDVWRACITPNDGYEDGATNCSNNLTIVEVPLVCPAGMSGSNTSLSPCLVTNCTQLQNISLMLSNYYALANDVNCSDTVNWDYNGSQYLGFEPVGDNTNRFTGKLNGTNHTITGLYIYRPSTSYVGLFGFCGSGTEINDLGLEGVNVTGNDRVGGLFGASSGGIDIKINRVYITGNVRATNFMAGCIGGDDDAIVRDVYANCNVTAVNGYAGGVFGHHSFQQLHRVYATGNVNGTDNIGGLIGRMYGSQLKYSFSTANVTGTGNVGGIIGEIGGTVTLTDVYWNNHSGNSQNCTGTGNSSGCTAIQDNEEYFFDVSNPPMVNWSYPPWDSFCDDSGYTPLEWENITNVTECRGYTHNRPPTQATPILNSTSGTNSVIENLTCWANATDIDGDNVSYEGYWYRNEVQNISFNTTPTNYTPGILVNVSTLNSSMTSIGDNWSCYVRAFDGINYSSYVMSDNLTILEVPNAPVINSINATPSQQGYGKNVTITANITDQNNDINTVLVGIAVPGQAETNYSMANVSEIYYYQYLDYANGTYNATVYVNDTAGLSAKNSTAFELFVNNTVQIKTLKDYYGENEWVNLTDPPNFYMEVLK